jgi:glycosyltransferase involved in cell wall biosynthesis
MRILRSFVTRGLRFALAHPNHLLVVQNPDDRDLLISLRIAHADRTIVIPGSGLDFSRFRPTPEPEPSGPTVVLMASRLLWDKGVGEYVAAAHELRRRGSRARFLLAGEADHGHPCAVPWSTVESWCAAGEVEWLGWQEDMPALMAKSHIVCLPSYYGEGIPRVLIEAAASGRAIVTTDLPGCRETVEHGRSGLLVPPRDVAALTAAIAQLLEDTDGRVKMGIRGRELAVARFAQDRVLATNLAIHHQALEALGRSGRSRRLSRLTVEPSSRASRTTGLDRTDRPRIIEDLEVARRQAATASSRSRPASEGDKATAASVETGDAAERA